MSDIEYLQMAIDESRKCTPSNGAYSVGAVVVTSSGGVYSGYTHETNPTNHAEEEAVAKALGARAELRGATIYTSMEPCSTRKSKTKSCTQLILEMGFSRVVYALAEPPHFVDCCGAETLRDAGVEVVQLMKMAEEVNIINRHITGIK